MNIGWVLKIKLKILIDETDESLKIKEKINIKMRPETTIEQKKLF